MNDQIKVRGWMWDRSEKPTQWVALRCLTCGDIMTYPARTTDGRRCNKCESGNVILEGYVRKVREIR